MIDCITWELSPATYFCTWPEGRCSWCSSTVSPRWIYEHLWWVFFTLSSPTAKSGGIKETFLNLGFFFFKSNDAQKHSMPPLAINFPSVVGFLSWKPAFIVYFLSCCRAKQASLLFFFYLAVFCCDESKGLFAWCSEDIQKLPLATVICCNPPDRQMIDSYEPIAIFLNLSAFLEKKVQ